MLYTDKSILQIDCLMDQFPSSCQWNNNLHKKNISLLDIKLSPKTIQVILIGWKRGQNYCFLSRPDGSWTWVKWCAGLCVHLRQISLILPLFRVHLKYQNGTSNIQCKVHFGRLFSLKTCWNTTRCLWVRIELVQYSTFVMRLSFWLRVWDCVLTRLTKHSIAIYTRKVSFIYDVMKQWGKICVVHFTYISILSGVIVSTKKKIGFLFSPSTTPPVS